MVDLEGATILVVDDTPANLKLIASMLGQQGYRVRPATSGKVALRACEKEAPDLILLDINMPEMDGFEVCEKLKAQPDLRDIPVIFLSALTETEDKVKAFAVGGVDYVTKPFQFEEIQARVEVQLTLRRLSLELQKTNAELEDRVRERTRELAALNEVYERFVPREFLGCLDKESILEVGLGDQVQRDMTVAFSDIRDFTALSEGMTPQENFDFLNEYLSRISPVIHEHGGFVDKFMGDAVMALFPRGAKTAVDCAIGMAKQVRSFSADLVAEGRPPLRTGTGLHTGNIMLGIIGSQKRFDATVISDAVNLASRLEDLTKLYGVSILISEDTLAALGNSDKYLHRFLGRVQVKGKNVPVRVHEIFDADAASLRELKAETKEGFEKGLELYYEREFAEAAVRFKRVLEVLPEEHAFQLYLERSAHYLGNGTSPDWTGVEMMADK